MYHVTIIGSREKGIPIAMKLLAKEHSLSITIVETDAISRPLSAPRANIPRQVSILDESSSSIHIKGNCLQLENNDYLYYDFLIVESESVDHLNFTI